MDFISLLTFTLNPSYFLLESLWSISEPPEVWKNYDKHKGETEEKLFVVFFFFFRARIRQKISSLIESDQRAPFIQVSLLNSLCNTNGLWEGFQRLIGVTEWVALSSACSFPRATISLPIPVYCWSWQRKRDHVRSNPYAINMNNQQSGPLPTVTLWPVSCSQ